MDRFIDDRARHTTYGSQETEIAHFDHDFAIFASLDKHVLCTGKGRAKWEKNSIMSCENAHTPVYVCLHACTHACMSARLHVCMYACTHVCMYMCVWLSVRVYTRLEVAMDHALLLHMQKSADELLGYAIHQLIINHFPLCPLVL